MDHMKEASVRDLRYNFRKIEGMLRKGEEIAITKRRRVIGRLVPERPKAPPAIPDFMGRMREIYGDTVFETSGAKIIAEGRGDR
jgi:antitoxin (DNA-binding transcriptional repressor) of toxin-antitoxin stability system